MILENGGGIVISGPQPVFTPLVHAVLRREDSVGTVANHVIIQLFFEEGGVEHAVSGGVVLLNSKVADTFCGGRVDFIKIIDQRVESGTDDVHFSRAIRSISFVSGYVVITRDIIVILIHFVRIIII